MAKKTLFRLEFETEYRVVGVFCPEKDYRFCWLLNSKMGYNFRRLPDFEQASVDGNSSDFYSVFGFEIESLQRTYFLMNNRSGNGSRLFSSPPGLDYLMLVKADESRFNFSDLVKKIRSLPQVTASYLLDDILGKNKGIFLYDFELYVTQKGKIQRN